MEQYTRTTWTDDDLITAFKLNKMEQGIVQASDLASKTNLLSGGATGQMLVKASDTDMDIAWADAPSGGVTSFNGRIGDISPASGDYTADMVGARASDWMPTAANVGAIANTPISKIQVLTEDEYTALAAKSYTTLYLIKEN